jgi:hypothetical protein
MNQTSCPQDRVNAPIHACAPQRGALTIEPVRVRHDKRHSGVSPLCVVDFGGEQEFNEKRLAEDGGSVVRSGRPGSVGLSAGVYLESHSYSRTVSQRPLVMALNPACYQQRTGWGDDGEPECSQAFRYFADDCDDRDGVWARA